MKKILWIPVLLIVLFVGDRIAGGILSTLVSKANFRYSKLYAQDTGAADILTIGNSRGLMFYQPAIEELTGQSTLNLSYNGLPVSAAEVLIKDYLDKYKAPQKILFEVTCADRANVPLVSGFNSYAKYSPRLQELIKENSVNSYYGGKLSHLFRYNSEIFQRTLRYLKSSDKDWLNDREISAYMMEQATKEKPLDFTFAEALEKEEFTPEELIEKIVSVVQYAKEKGTTIELIINPYYPVFGERSKGFGAWKREVENATGQKVHDYSSALTDSKHFTDYQHTNKTGSTVFMKMLYDDGLLK